MARIAGIDIPDSKKIEFSIRYIYGVGPSNAVAVLETAKIAPGVRVRDLKEEDLARLQKAVENLTIEGDLRREVQQNVKRLEEIGSYRGARHRHGLPVHGQRTRSNARTKRGKRKTVGTIKKETR